MDCDGRILLSSRMFAMVISKVARESVSMHPVYVHPFSFLPAISMHFVFFFLRFLYYVQNENDRLFRLDLDRCM